MSGYNPRIKRPIFIVGTGRSGTTIFYNLLCGHQALGWFSNYTKSFPCLSPLSRLNVLFKIPVIAREYRHKGRFPKPNEGYPLWDRFHPVVDSSGSPPFTEKDVIGANVEYMQSTIEKHLYHSNTQRFLNKNTRNTRRTRYLHAIFPDALFIHVIRDGRAVAHSLVNVKFWATLSLWWRNEYTPLQLKAQGELPLLVAAKHWEAGVKRMLDDAKYLSAEQYVEVRYEDLIRHPKTVMRQVLYFCDLPWTSQFEEHIDSFTLENRNFRWPRHYTSGEIEEIETEIHSTLQLHGYV